MNDTGWEVREERGPPPDRCEATTTMQHATNVPHCLMETMSCPAQVPRHQPQQGNPPPARHKAMATMRHINGCAPSSDSDGVVPSPGTTSLPVTWQPDTKR
ncbi:hypothetical protein K443DRAFT_6102 [Laccaria amethystina LaAM-08-1]|uniref:Uncharacterized protein n=1 Tax=Laccaria amethystina LaAM-08-1 TaxID=1095629 RepID=A0A0C9Y2Z8_9AGAR|nr:hypothetical protein K443DRAFT_6102 [Laccaria amethystina LaAM-08-1]